MAFLVILKQAAPVITLKTTLLKTPMFLVLQTHLIPSQQLPPWMAVQLRSLTGNERKDCFVLFLKRTSCSDRPPGEDLVAVLTFTFF
jgi:hypothetical protein